MIEITRSLARKLVAVLQKSVWATSGRKRIPPVLFRVGPQGLAVSSQYEGLAVRYTQRGRHRSQSLVVPGQVLRTCAGEGKAPVRLEQLRGDRGMASWEDGKQSHEQEFLTSDPDEVPPFPEHPERFQPAEDNFLNAFHDATSCAASEDGRYTLANVQLRSTGIIVGTDGRELLWQEGFSFPWGDDVLVPATRVFERKSFQGKPALIGRTAAHIVVRVGDWTIALPVITEGRFPNAEEVIKNLPSDATRWHIPSDEAAFLLDQLRKLPVDEDNQAITIDLGPGVCIRAGTVPQERGIELCLRGSSVSGPAIRINSHPHYLRHALKLGFRTFDLVPTKPIHSREGDRLYLWMPLC
jgi:hypothetical protein